MKLTDACLLLMAFVFAFPFMLIMLIAQGVGRK
jgi:hypothetical protein